MVTNSFGNFLSNLFIVFKTNQLKRKLQKHSHATVRCSSSWSLSLLQPEGGDESLKQLISWRVSITKSTPYLVSHTKRKANNFSKQLKGFMNIRKWRIYTRNCWMEFSDRLQVIAVGYSSSLAFRFLLWRISSDKLNRIV